MIRRAAEAGSTRAMLILANFYNEGALGLGYNPAEAKRLIAEPPSSATREPRTCWQASSKTPSNRPSPFVDSRYGPRLDLANPPPYMQEPAAGHASARKGV